jgi:hypothetical protein
VFVFAMPIERIVYGEHATRSRFFFRTIKSVMHKTTQLFKGI